VRLLVVGGAIASGNCAFAQIEPDRTLPNNSSITTQDNTNIITGGTQAGSNLFHSFEEFSVPNGSTAYFNNALDIQNIISRVTGSSISDINGLLKANYSANLFLINPNGIIFGPNARLDIGGSFVASTANSINFADGNQFSAKAAQQSVPLLTISVPVGLQYEGNVGNVEVQGSSLQVKPSKSLALLGGNVSMNGGQIAASGGRVELGGLAGTGTVGLSADGTGNLLSLSFPNGVARADVSLTNKAGVDVTAAGGGSIAVNVRNLEISGEGILSTGISQNSGAVGAVAGDIIVDATGTVTLRESSVMQNTVGSRTTGSAGNVNLTAGSLYLISGSQLFTSTFGQGNAGNVNVNVRDTVSFDSGGNGGNGSTSGIISSVGDTGEGNARGINITTGSLWVTNGAQLNAITKGQGNAGNVTIVARDKVSIDGANKGASGILSAVSIDNNGKQAEGNGGNINITTGSLLVTNGAELNAVTKGQGNAGNVTIIARDMVSLDGEKKSNGTPSQILTSVDSNEYSGYPNLGPASGNGGEIKITTRSLSITRGAALNALTKGQGNAGNVTIVARDTVSFDGENSKGGASGVYSSVADNLYTGQPPAKGNGGEINIKTGSLSITRGGGVFANTRGQGDAARVIINARDKVSLDGENSKGGASGVFSSVGDENDLPPTVGNGGEMKITTGSLSLTNGGGLYTSTSGEGDAGDVTIIASDAISLDGLNSKGGSSGIFSSVNTTGVGKGGDISITTSSLSLTNSAVLNANSNGQGTAGNIDVGSRSIRLGNRAGILATTTSGDGGNLNLNIRDLLLLRHRSRISTTAGTASAGGNGGNISINAPNGFVIAPPNENSDITANAFTGSGGRVRINSFSIFGMEQRRREDLVQQLGTSDASELNPEKLPTNDITAISQTNPTLDGIVQLNTPDVNPTQGLVNLPSVPVDTEISQVCQPRPVENQSQFIVTGRGGLPSNPRQVLRSQAVDVGWVMLKPEVGHRARGVESRSSSNRNLQNANSVNYPQTELMEAQGWTIDANGNITLVAQAPTANPHSPWFTPTSCPVR
jgi:filamentous hemagglutinin family protein